MYKYAYRQLRCHIQHKSPRSENTTAATTLHKRHSDALCVFGDLYIEDGSLAAERRNSSFSFGCAFVALCR